VQPLSPAPANTVTGAAPATSVLAVTPAPAATNTSNTPPVTAAAPANSQTADTNSPVAPAVSLAADTMPTTTNIASIGQSSGNAGQQQVSNLTPDKVLSSSPIQIDVVATPGQDNPLQISMSSPTDVVEGLVPDAPDVPNVDDIAAAFNGAGGRALAGPSNIVHVDDYSQTNLSSLVNVNAAGSIVPVVLNITININSTVESLKNTNTINISNFTNFSFQ